MSGQRYPEEFKIEAVKQVTEWNHAASDVAHRHGVTSHSIYNCIKRYGPKASVTSLKQIKLIELERWRKSLSRLLKKGTS